MLTGGEPRHPVFVALRETVREFDIPQQSLPICCRHFARTRWSRAIHDSTTCWATARYSANPVGHLVLYLCGYRDAERQKLSDYTCTALQLANFWQDVSVDYRKGPNLSSAGRLREVRRQRRGTWRTASDAAVSGHDEVRGHNARACGSSGLPLAKQVDRRLALDIELFSRGGLEILRAIESQEYDVLTSRPVISKRRKVLLLARAALGKFVVSEHPLQLRAAYSVCRHIARSAAKNFYYGFLVLPAHKRNALSAVYAFMRHADDISEIPARPANSVGKNSPNG